MGRMDEDSPLIYGLEAPARALAAGPAGAGEGLVRFLTATQLLRQSSNALHVLEYVEETHSLAKALLRHASGEVWSLAACPRPQSGLVTTVHDALHCMVRLAPCAVLAPPASGTFPWTWTRRSRTRNPRQRS